MSGASRWQSPQKTSGLLAHAAHPPLPGNFGHTPSQTGVPRDCPLAMALLRGDPGTVTAPPSKGQRVGLVSRLGPPPGCRPFWFKLLPKGHQCCIRLLINSFRAYPNPYQICPQLFSGHFYWAAFTLCSHAYNRPYFFPLNL